MEWETWIREQRARPLESQRIEVEKCSRSAAYFINAYCWGRDERDITGEPWALRCWPAQSWLLQVILSTVLLCILKGRQLGITWLAIAYGVWLVTFHANVYVLLFSQREEEAKELLKRAKFIRSHLPAWLQADLVGDSTMEIETARGSRMKVFPSRGAEARTYAAALAIVDEAGTVPNLSAMITAILSVVKGGGRLIVLGTGKGINDFFTLVQRIRVGLAPGWRFVFLPWWSRPDRGPGWREEQAGDYPERWQLLQEHPASPDEAFQLGHRPRFDTDRIKGLLDRIRDPLPEQLLAAEVGDLLLKEAILSGALRVWRRPKENHRYLVAADTSEGIPGLDRCAAVVLDGRLGLPVADLAGYWPDHIYAAILAALGHWYTAAVLAVERNNTGASVINSLVNVERYAKLYRGRAHERARGARYGWVTSTGSKPLMYDALDKALADGSRRWYSERFLMEALTCERRDDGTVGAPEREGFYDDVLTAYAIAEAVRQEQRW